MTAAVHRLLVDLDSDEPLDAARHTDAAMQLAIKAGLVGYRDGKLHLTDKGRAALGRQR